MMEDIRARVAEIEARFTPRSAPPPPPAQSNFPQMLEAQAMRLGAPTFGPYAAVTTMGDMWGQPVMPHWQTQGPSWPQRTGSVPENAARFQPLFEAAGAQYGVDPDLLAAVAWTESAFNPNAVSHAGALGLMQIMPGTAAGLGVDPLDPVGAVDGAARYLRQQMNRFGDVRLALAAYNAGPGAVEKHGGIPPYEETMAYVGKVLGRYDQLRSSS